MISKVQGNEVNLFRQSKSSIYTLLDNQKHESTAVPINPNTLNYIDKEVERNYNKELYQDKITLSCSDEYKRVIIYYYICLTSLLLSLIGFSVLLYSSNKSSKVQFSIQISIIVTLLISSFVILCGIFNSIVLLLTNRTIFTSFGILLNTYLIICDDRVLSSLLSEDYSSDGLPYSIVLVCSCVLLKNLLFDDFFHYLLIIIHAIVLFLAIHLSFSEINVYSKICEFSVIAIILIYQLIECHINCVRSKVIYWHKYNEEQIVGNNSEINKDKGNEFETETEHLMYICEKVKIDIKFAVKAIIFKDIKDRLKTSLSNLQRIKKIIGHRSVRDSIIMIEDHVKDLEDREFIHQNYQELLSSSDIRRSTTIVKFSEGKNNLVHEYGLDELSSVMESIGKNWSFDIWFVHDATGKSVSLVGRHLFNKYGLSNHFDIPDDILDAYLLKIEKYYNDNPYHNACHGADVLHSMMYFYLNSDIHKFLNPIETMASIIAGLGHDVGHPGVTSRYLITTRDPLSLQFNDISVLESMHCSTIYQLMLKAGCNIFANLDQEDWTISRKIIIEMVLATDMAKHFEILGRFRTRASILGDLNLDKFEDKLLIFSTALKAADIGHSAKYTDLHEKWSKLVMEEFFKQGDLEKSKNLPVSMYCDRKNTNVPKSQAGFLRNICLPLYEIWAKYLNNENIEKTLTQLKNNIEFWDITKKSRRSTQPIPNDNLIQFKSQESLAVSNGV